MHSECDQDRGPNRAVRALVVALIVAWILLPVLLWAPLTNMNLIADSPDLGAYVVCLLTQLGLAGLGVRLFSLRPFSKAPGIIVTQIGVCLALVAWILGAGLTVMLLAILSALIMGEITRFLIWTGTWRSSHRYDQQEDSFLAPNLIS